MRRTVDRRDSQAVGLRILNVHIPKNCDIDDVLFAASARDCAVAPVGLPVSIRTGFAAVAPHVRGLFAWTILDASGRWRVRQMSC